jgi:uridine kinase
MDLNPIIIGIAGGTGSGKSTLADNIKKEFDNNITMISHDYYYKDHPDLSFEERVKLNYDHPDSIETSLLIEHLKRLKNGEIVYRPNYSFVEHKREETTVEVVPKKVIILDGILIFENKELRDMMDIKIFVDTDADIRFIRRLLRDVEKRGRTLNSVVSQYCTTVKPMHEQFVEPSKKFADIIVPEGGHNEVALNMIIEKVRSIM